MFSDFKWVFLNLLIIRTKNINASPYLNYFRLR